MQVTKLTVEQIGTVPHKHQYTDEELQREYAYILAEKMTKSLLDNHHISLSEYNKIMVLNCKTFSPYLAEIMPK